MTPPKTGQASSKGSDAHAVLNLPSCSIGPCRFLQGVSSR
jgi:hypothetical protein